MKTSAEIYALMQAKWVELNGIKIGSKVKLLRKFKDCEDGFYYIWVDNISKNISKEGAVTEIRPNSIAVRFSVNNSAYIPYFCLEPVENKPKEFNIDILKCNYKISHKEMSINIKKDVTTVGETEINTGNFINLLKAARKLGRNFHNLEFKDNNDNLIAINVGLEVPEILKQYDNCFNKTES